LRGFSIVTKRSNFNPISGIIETGSHPISCLKFTITGNGVLEENYSLIEDIGKLRILGCVRNDHKKS
jgi:hypothetical protein